MAQLAAQDYFARLQASGLSPFQHPELAAAFPGMGMGGSSSAAGRQGAGDGKNNAKSRKEKKSNNSTNAMVAGLGASTTITPSVGNPSAYKV